MVLELAINKGSGLIREFVPLGLADLFTLMLNMVTTVSELHCEVDRAPGIFLTFRWAWQYSSRLLQAVLQLQCRYSPQVPFVPQLFEEAARCRRIPWQQQRLSDSAAWPCPGSWWLFSKRDHPRGAWNWSIRILKIFVMPSCHFSEQHRQKGVETDGSKPSGFVLF